MEAPNLESTSTIETNSVINNVPEKDLLNNDNAESYEHWPSDKQSVAFANKTSFAMQATKHLILLTKQEQDDELLDYQLTTPEFTRICFVAWKSFVHYRDLSSPDAKDSTVSFARHKLRRIKIKADTMAINKQLSVSHLQSKAATYLHTFLFHRCRHFLRESFRTWNSAIKNAKWGVSRYFHNWNLLITHQKLNKLKFARFLPLLPRLNSVATARLQQRAIELWHEGISHRRKMRHVRLLFTCWRTAARSCGRGRSIRMKLAFREWHNHARAASHRCRQQFMRYYLRAIKWPVARKHCLRGALCKGHTVHPLRQAMVAWLLVCGHGPTGSMNLHRRGVAIMDAIAIGKRNSLAATCSSPRSSCSSPRGPATSSRVLTPSTSRDKNSLSPRQAPSTPHTSTPRKEGQAWTKPQHTPRIATPSSVAWNKEMMNVSSLASGASVAGKGHSGRYISSRSLLLSPDRANQTPLKQQNQRKSSNSSMKTGNSAAANHQIRSLMADPLERFKLRLLGLKSVSALVISGVTS